LSRIIVAFLLAGLTLADGPEDELNRFQGRWKLVKEHIAKKDRQGVESEWLIEGDKLTVTDRITGRGKITLDPTAKPGRFEKTFADDTARRLRGVYRLEGDKFITYFRFASADQDPTEFPAKPDRRHILETWKRTDGPGGKGIDGEWELLDRIIGDNTIKYKDHLMKIVNGEYTVDARSVSHYSIRLNPAAALKQLDRKILDAKPPIPESKVFLEVYSFNGGHLTVWGEHFQPGTRTFARPDSVSDAPDSENFFRVFEKVNLR
jgi:uncharacterized protein (TIGR03067 family)